MAEWGAADLASAALYAVPALVWAAVTAQSWEYLRLRRPRSRLLRMLPVATGMAAVHCLAGVTWALAAGDQAMATGLAVIRDLTGLAGVVAFRHTLRYLPAREQRPSVSWLVAYYGVGAAVAVAAVTARVASGPTDTRLGVVAATALWGYVLTVSVLCVRQVAREARGRGFGLGGVAEMRRPDVVVIGAGLAVALVALLVLGLMPGTAERSTALVIADVAVSLSALVPVVVRMLGLVVRRVLVMTATLAMTAGLLWVHTTTGRAVGGPVLDLAVLLGLGVVLGPGHAWLNAAVDRTVFRRRQHRLETLQAFLHTLSPELGIDECCRRVLQEIAGVMHVPAAAILLRDGEAVVHGEFAIAPIQRAWPRGAAVDALPVRAFGTADLRELPQELKDALAESGVGLGVYPIISPRGRRGHLFLSTGLLGTIAREDDVQAFEVVTAQLALVLDGAELLTRTVAVERSLAHAEKLAAIGELAARVAHEIRNPVTAARSLAQQLCRAPAAPQNADSAGLILTELERVERQVAALLRFAGREDLRLEPVDVAELARATSETYRPRCEAAGVALEVDAKSGVVARADRERLRQVLINLLDNALDALAEASGARRLAVHVGSRNGSAVVQVRDTGPGLAADVLPRVFEPFFSLKSTGTGLGLAIARRTVEAHGGHLTAADAEGGGACFAMELPLAGGDDRVDGPR